jgi:hypothetical protein
MLGVHFEDALSRTEDVDIVGDPELLLALRPDTELTPLPTEDAQPLRPIPPLNHKHPSTSFRVRGTELRLDVLVPLVGRRKDKPVLLPGLNVYGTPLRFLDFLVETPVQAAIVSGEGVLVKVPQPARFALHKLLVAGERSSAFAAKAKKDLRQAGVLLEALLEDRPGDLLLAHDDLVARGSGWTKRMRKGLKGLDEGIQQGLRQLLA